MEGWSEERQPSVTGKRQAWEAREVARGGWWWTEAAQPTESLTFCVWAQRRSRGFVPRSGDVSVAGPSGS